MKTKSLLFSILITASAASTAQTVSLPYAADWKYQDGQFENDTDAGKPTSNTGLYNLGGWETIKTSGSRLFYIAVSQGAPIANTLEFTDDKQDPKQHTAWLISPAFDFSANTDKQISFKCGREYIQNHTSNLELLYSTDYAGNAETATWVSVKATLIPDSQAGLGPTKMENINVTLPIVAPSVVLAIKADKVEGKSSTAQSKIRVTAFNISESARIELATLPYAAAWHYKEEIVQADSTLNLTMDPNAGLYNGNREFYNLGGWTLANSEGSRSFFLSRSKMKPIPNTLEFTDDSQKNPITTWIVSPAIDFSDSMDKYVSFLCGKENIDQQSSNIDLLYSTDFDGDVTKASWNVIRSKVLAAEQNGLNELTMAMIEEKMDLVAEKVYFAIRASKDGSAGSKQAKLRVKNFQITPESIASGMESTTTSKEVSLYPNPVKEMVYLTNAEEVALVEIFTVAGQKAMAVANPMGAIQIAHLSQGCYVVKITKNDNSASILTLIKK